MIKIQGEGKKLKLPYSQNKTIKKNSEHLNFFSERL